MKHLIWLFLAILVSSSCLFGQAATRGTVTSQDGEKFLLYIDGKVNNSMPGEQVQIPLFDGEAMLKIVFSNKRLGSVSRKIYQEDEPVSYILYKQNGVYAIREDRDAGMITSPSGVATLPVGNNVETSGATGETIVIKSGSSESGRSGDRGKRISSPFIGDGLFCSSPTISDVNFARMKAVIDQKYFDSDRTLEIKRVIDNNCMLAEQVAALIRLIKYNNQNQVEIAKYAYVKTVNTTAYELVIETLKDENQRIKVRDFVSATGRTNHGPLPPGPLPYPRTNNDNPGRTCQLKHMNNQDFDAARAVIKASPFEDSRLEQAKGILKNRCFSVAQIRGFMKCFDFERSKLDFAKYAFDFTHEKDQYYLVNQEFTFDVSKRELQEFTDGQD